MFKTILPELKRERYAVDQHQAPYLVIEGRSYLNFTSSDYLNLAKHPDVIQVCQETLSKNGLGSGASPMLSGYHTAHQALEEEIAHFLQKERCVFFSNAYMANLSVISALMPQSSRVFTAKQAHASIIDALLLSKASFYRYSQDNKQHLIHLLDRYHQRESSWLISEGIFSMQGHITDVPSLVALKKRYPLQLMIDDTHAFGILGANGRGSAEHHHLSSEDIDIVVGGFGKAGGSYGGFAAGNADIIDPILQRARPYMYSTALPPVIVQGNRQILRCLQQETWRRNTLQANIRYFQRGLQASHLPWKASNSPIQILTIGDNQTALNMGQALKEQGILVSVIRPPSVPPNQACLRISLTCAHTCSIIDRLLEQLVQYVTNTATI